MCRSCWYMKCAFDASRHVGAMTEAELAASQVGESADELWPITMEALDVVYPLVATGLHVTTTSTTRCFCCEDVVERVNRRATEVPLSLEEEGRDVGTVDLRDYICRGGSELHIQSCCPHDGTCGRTQLIQLTGINEWVAITIPR